MKKKQIGGLNHCRSFIYRSRCIQRADECGVRKDAGKQCGDPAYRELYL